MREIEKRCIIKYINMLHEKCDRLSKFQHNKPLSHCLKCDTMSISFPSLCRRHAQVRHHEGNFTLTVTHNNLKCDRLRINKPLP